MLVVLGEYSANKVIRAPTWSPRTRPSLKALVSQRRKNSMGSSQVAMGAMPMVQQHEGTQTACGSEAGLPRPGI